MNYEPLSWHQRKAARDAYRLRKKKAHIHSIGYITTGKSLCGQKDFPAYVLPEHAGNPDNNVCKKCLAKLSSQPGETK